MIEFSPLFQTFRKQQNVLWISKQKLGKENFWRWDDNKDNDIGNNGRLTAGMFAAPFVGLFTGAVIGGLISVICVYKANGAAAVKDGCSEVDVDKEWSLIDSW